MDIRDVEKNLKKQDAKYLINAGVSEGEIEKSQTLLGETFPEQVADFYRSCNGLNVTEKLEIYKLEDLQKDGALIEFAIFDNKHSIAFDISSLNIAGQWDIVNSKNHFIITHTMASFITNKIWAWLHRERKVWDEERY